MPRPTHVFPSLVEPAEPAAPAAPAATPRAKVSDAERAARGRAQIAAGQYLDDDGLDAFLDDLQISATKA